MKGKTRNALLLGGGFLIGTVGVKALASPTAKKCYVQGVAQGIRAKRCYQDIVEQAKAQVDDIVAEANYIAVKDDEKADEDEGAGAAKATKKAAK